MKRIDEDDPVHFHVHYHLQTGEGEDGKGGGRGQHIVRAGSRTRHDFTALQYLKWGSFDCMLACPECRSTGTPNARLVSEKPNNPCTPLRTHTKRDHPAEDMKTSAPSDKRPKQQHSQVEHLNQCHTINLISDGKSVSKLDQHTVQMLLRHLQLSECLHECADCQIYFVDREMWLRHRDQMHTRAEPDQPFVCAVCSTNLGNRLDFLTHFVQNHRTEPEHSHGLPLSHTVQSFPGQDLLKSNHSDIPALLKPYPNENGESSRDLLEENLVPQQSNGPISPQSDPCPSPISFSRSDSQVNESNYPGHSPVQHLSVMAEANSIPSIISTQS
ncbi:hypothetical protein FGIG_07743 [Fasciola gigantica]|uniref:C2H2-type domain-containing protein n=1 Tax=Fasciola gigantica TaxID=46835 RepID=A0A504Y880_FASGI|nr:hypothetical protein FGIG_07743 [Fasciola gigantica]